MPIKKLTKSKPLVAKVGPTKTQKSAGVTKKVATTKPKAKVTSKAAAGKTDSVGTGVFGDYEGYCVKCKEKGAKFHGEVFENPTTGRRMAKGPHKCGTVVCRILGKS